MAENKMGFEPKFDDNKKSGIVYMGKNIKDSNGSAYRKVEVIIDLEESYLSDKNKEPGSTPVGFAVKENVVLYSSLSGQQKIQCWLMESVSGKKLDAIHISRRTGRGVYGSQEVTLTLPEIVILKDFIDNLYYVDMTNKSAMKIPISELNRSIKSSSLKILSEEEFAGLIRANLKSTDDFYRLLSLQKMDIAVERLENILSGDYINEVSIQKFLRENIWMFGNDYVFVVEENKINANNILDLIPQNIESYIDIIEVKLPNEKLFAFDSSHHNYYPTSNLTRAISQTQNYVFELENKVNDEKYQQKNNCKIIRPRGIILYGSDIELNDDEKKYLRILNASYHNLQIVTYQQLLEKAKNTIKFQNWNK